MERILIIGCGGAGKSTLARALGEKTGLPVVHLDKLFWNPGWVETPKAEFDSLLRREMEKPQWIMDGNYHRTLPERLKRCDTAIYLDFNRFDCLMGIARRVTTTYGRVRPDMGAGCPERFDWDFLKWVWNFNKRNRIRYHQALSQAENAQVYILKNRREVRRFLDHL